MLHLFLIPSTYNYNCSKHKVPKKQLCQMKQKQKLWKSCTKNRTLCNYLKFRVCSNHLNTCLRKYQQKYEEGLATFNPKRLYSCIRKKSQVSVPFITKNKDGKLTSDNKESAEFLQINFIQCTLGSHMEYCLPQTIPHKSLLNYVILKSLLRKLRNYSPHISFKKLLFSYC